MCVNDALCLLCSSCITGGILHVSVQYLQSHVWLVWEGISIEFMILCTSCITGGGGGGREGGRGILHVSVQYLHVE